MLSRVNESLHVYLTSSHVYARRVSGLPLRRRIETAGDWEWQSDRAESLTFAPLNPNNRKGIALCLHIGSALSKLMTFVVPPGVSGDKEVKRVVQAQMHDQWGLAPAEWELAIDRSATGPAIVCAIRCNTMRAMRQAAASANLQLRSVRPYAANVWNIYHEKSRLTQSALMVIESDAYSLFVAKDGRIASANARLHFNRPDVVEQDLQRLAMTSPELERDAIRLAVRDEDRALLLDPAYSCLTRSEYLECDHYSDFRDLAFAGEAA